MSRAQSSFTIDLIKSCESKHHTGSNDPKFIHPTAFPWTPDSEKHRTHLPCLAKQTSQTQYVYNRLLFSLQNLSLLVIQTSGNVNIQLLRTLFLECLTNKSSNIQFQNIHIFKIYNFRQFLTTFITLF